MRLGATAALATAMTRLATTQRRGQITAWALGLAVFVDDYANALIVGPTLRPAMDRLGVAREKFAFIVDATSAPVASVALVSSWIAAEISFVGDEFKALGLDMDPAAAVYASLAHRYYPWLMLGFVLMTAVSPRAFGPMWAAEREAAKTKNNSAPLPQTPHRRLCRLQA